MKIQRFCLLMIFFLSALVFLAIRHGLMKALLTLCIMAFSVCFSTQEKSWTSVLETYWSIITGWLSNNNTGPNISRHMYYENTGTVFQYHYSKKKIQIIIYWVFWAWFFEIFIRTEIKFQLELKKKISYKLTEKNFQWSLKKNFS